MGWKGAKMRASLWLSLSLLMYLPYCIAGSDSYTDCVTDDVFGFPLLCLNATFEDNCRLHVAVSVTNTSAPVLEGTMNVEQSRALCTSYNACELCARLDNFAVDTESDTVSGCFSVITRECLLDFMEGEQQLECFSFANATAADCLDCPSNCGGEERGTCQDGHCSCKAGWLPPTCVEEDVEPTPPPAHSDTTQCLTVGNPLDIDLCAEMWIHDCDAYFNVTLNGRELANATVDLIRSEQLFEPQCTELYVGCEGCLMVENLTLMYSEELKANYFNVCSALQLDDNCFAILDADNLRLELGCTQVLASQCHLCDTDCSGHGECVDGLCQCDEGHHGYECEYNFCPNNCSGNGDCYDGVCDCYDLFLGDDCSSECTGAIYGLHLVNQKWYEAEEATGEVLLSVEDPSDDEPTEEEESYEGADEDDDDEEEVEEEGGEEDGDGEGAGAEGEEEEEENNVGYDGYEVDDEEANDNAWRGWIEVGHNTAGISVGIGALEANETTTIALLVRKDCPPTSEAFDFSVSIEMTDARGLPLVIQEFFELFEDCAMREPHGTWFFAVYCLQGARCPFRINVWVTPISMAFPGVKLFNRVSPPHFGYHVVSLTSANAVDLLVKVKTVSNAGGDALRVHRRFEDCPSLAGDGDQYVLSTPEAVESTVYSYAYHDSFISEEPGTWYIAIVPNFECDALEEKKKTCPEVQYSLLVQTRYLCIPPCVNGGTCSETLENTCICPDDGHTGVRCELVECLPACEHGECVGPNECACEEGWMGPTCIDVDHDHSPIPFGQFAASTPASTYAIVLLLCVLALLTAAMVAVFALSCDEGSAVGRLRVRIMHRFNS